MYDVICYTDGGCAPTNPGIGGYGVKLLCPAIGLEKELTGGFTWTTNNRMELMAVIVALEALTPTNVGRVTIYADSSYVVNAFNKKWIDGWIKTNWKKGQLLNLDLWHRLYLLTTKFNVRFVWIKGHSGNVHNNRVDALCQVGRSKAISHDSGYISDKFPCSI